jgi:hypothetical protein
VRIAMQKVIAASIRATDERERREAEEKPARQKNA